MPKRVEVPGKGIFEFPDEMPDARIAGLIRTQVLGNMPGLPTTEAGTPERMQELRETDPTNYTPPPFSLRTLLEGGLSSAGAALVPGGGLASILMRAGAAGAGAGAGSLVSELAQPSEAPIREAATSAALGAGGEMIGGLAVKGLQRLFPARPVTPEAVEAQKIVSKVGGQLTPAQITDSRGLDIAENIAESSLIGGGAIKEVKKGTQQKLQDAIESSASRFASQFSPEQSGEAIQQAMERSEGAWRAASKEKYAAIDAAMRDPATGTPLALVDLRPVKDMAAKLQPGEVRLETGYLSNRLRNIQEMPDQVLFEEAHALRSDIMDIVRGVTAPGGPATGPQVKAKGPMARLAAETFQQMEETAKEVGGNAFQAWREADAFFREGAKTFNSALTRQVARATPDAVVGVIAKNARPYAIRSIRNTVDDVEAWRGVQASWLDQLLNSPGVTNATTGEMSGKALVRQLTRFGDEALSELFPSGAGSSLKRLGHALAFAQQKSPEATGNMMIQMSQAGAVLGLPASMILGSPQGALTSGAILIGPAIISKALTNPSIANLLIKGVNLSADASEASGLRTRLLALLAKEGLSTRSEDE
jgi:hypothetical protein